MERVQWFGADDHLMGTWHAGASSAALAVLLLNAGVVHRIGPHRIHVKLARALGTQGHASLRLDLSGLGDSGRVQMPADYREQACHDIGSTMDQLERRFGVRRFAVFGICSGAENGLEVAFRDPRVRGVYMVDGHAYPTARTRVLRYALAVQAHGPMHALRWLSKRIRTSAASTAIDDGQEEVIEERLSKADFAARLQALVDRQADVQMVYTGSVLDRYNHATQFRRSFGGHAFVDQVRCYYRPALDHTMTTLEAQRTLIDDVVAWANRIAQA